MIFLYFAVPPIFWLYNAFKPKISGFACLSASCKNLYQDSWQNFFSTLCPFFPEARAEVRRRLPPDIVNLVKWLKNFYRLVIISDISLLKIVQLREFCLSFALCNGKIARNQLIEYSISWNLSEPFIMRRTLHRNQ